MGEKPTIRLYDTLTRQKLPLAPEADGTVGMYVCGPTVYDRAHIGNARPVIVFDVLFRLLRHVHGPDKVVYVRNFTDVDDKIIAASVETGEPIEAITERTIGWYHEDMDAVGALRPTLEPRATEHIGEMIAMIETLIANGAAYAAEGHVLFAVKNFEGYGQLSKRSLDDMIAGARVEVAPYKRDPMDFVLWKPSEPGQPGWESPWGRGRPGWHIECSAMSEKTLGRDFAIHGGGVDLAFPHHENERAQSLCAHPGCGFARIWMHNGFVQAEGEKMSKSLGNFITVHDLKDSVPGEVIRLAMLTTHYRQPFDWTAKAADEARTVLERWRRIASEAEPAATPPEAVVEALADDLATPRAIAELHRLAGEGDAAGLKAGAALLGLLTPELGGWAAPREIDTAIAGRIEALLARRAEARKAKDFATSDAIRDGLATAGVAVRDSKEGASYELEREPDLAALGALEAKVGA